LTSPDGRPVAPACRPGLFSLDLATNLAGRPTVVPPSPVDAATVTMRPVSEFYDEALALQAQGVKPFRIVAHLLAAAKAAGIDLVVDGTLNNSELVFPSGQVIAFDGTTWQYRAAVEAGDGRARSRPRRPAD
jgi:hypothetical protein